MWRTVLGAETALNEKFSFICDRHDESIENDMTSTRYFCPLISGKISTGVVFDVNAFDEVTSRRTGN